MSKHYYMNPCLEDFWRTRKRYKVLYGGRGSSKTWDAAAQAVKLSSNIKLKFMCVRQFQANIRESVYTVLVDTIDRYKLTHEYHITDSTITHKITGSIFIFKGLWRNIDEVKSTEGIDVLWIEEGHNLTKEQFELLDPTIRAEGSEIWLIFNPKSRLDYSWKNFVEKPPANSIVRKINYDENPFLSQTMLDVIEAEKEKDLEAFEHTYLGYPTESSELSLFKYKDVDRAMKRRVKPAGATILGLDVARYGDDSSSICRRVGLKVFPIIQRSKIGGDEVANWAVAAYNMLGADGIAIDTIGVGGTVYDLVLKQVGFAIDGNNSMKASNPDRFHNKRAETYYNLAQDISKNLLELPEDDVLAEELLATEYFFSSAGRIQIVDKKIIKENIGRSPDKADSLALTYFTTIFKNENAGSSNSSVDDFIAPNVF